jgi:hypothetical protein
MTYEEALTIKETYGLRDYITTECGYPEHVIIAPELQADFIKFLSVFKHDFSLYNDDLSKEFSTNNSFIIRHHRVIYQDL